MLPPHPSTQSRATPNLAKTSGHPGFCIFIDTLCDGVVPLVRGSQGEPFVFPTRLEAEREIADNVITRLHEFIDGERDFEDAMTVEEYIVEVTVLSDGAVIDANGNQFGVNRP